MTYDRLVDALRLATELHGGQERDGDDPLPYVFHPVEVVRTLRAVGGETDETVLIAAMLHDTLEDTGILPELIERRFGPEVLALVVEVTRDEPTEAQRAGLDKDALWALRSDLLIEEIGRMSPAARRIKLADRLSNIREAKETRRGKKLDRYVLQTRRILEAIPRETSPALWDAIATEVGLNHEDAKGAKGREGG